MNILTIRETLKSGSPRQAERQLAKIGHEQGDESLALLVADLTPGEVASFLEEGDYSKPSEITQFLTPEQFMAALTRFGGKWGKLGKNDGKDVLLRLKEELASFILPLLLHRSDRLALKALLKDKLGEDILVILPLYESDYLEFLKDFHAGMAQRGTWQELYGAIEETDEKAFASLRKQVLELSERNDADKDNDEEEEEAEENSEGVRFMKRTLQRLSDQAAAHARKAPAEPETEDVFRGI